MNEIKDCHAFKNKKHIQRLQVLAVVLIVTIFLAFISLITLALITQQSTFHLAKSSLFNTEIELWGYCSFLIYLVGLFGVTITSLIYSLKLFKYISYLLGIIALCVSSVMLFISHKQPSWHDIYPLTNEIGLAAFATAIAIKNDNKKNIIVSLFVIGFILLLISTAIDIDLIT